MSKSKLKRVVYPFKYENFSEKTPEVPKLTSCFLSYLSNIFSIYSLWVWKSYEITKMHINWKALISLGIAFWGLLCCTDLLGESTWKKCSHNLEDILSHYRELTRMKEETKTEVTETPKPKMNWPVLLWNVCAFLCSLVFCSVLRSMSWFIWRIFKIYNVFRNRKGLTSKLGTAKVTDTTESSSMENPDSAKIIFKNQLFAKDANAIECKHLQEMKKERDELAQQLTVAQKENLTARQQIEEYKLETFMMKEKLTRTANTLKENLKYKDFASANQEVISRKAHNLELHLKEVCRDRDLLRTKLSSLEKNYTKLEDRLRLYTKQESETNLEQFPEKDTTTKPISEVTETEVDLNKFQKKIIDLQNTIGYEAKKLGFEANSKISVDLAEESSMETTKDVESELLQESSDNRKTDINVIKQNLMNYNAYKAQMLRPKLQMSNHLKDSLYSDTTGSSSEDTSAPHRIISSTVEFQNFLKTLTSNSKSSVTFENHMMF